MEKRKGYNSITLRVYKKDWDYIKKIYPPFKDESVASYLYRLRRWLAKVVAEWD